MRVATTLSKHRRGTIPFPFGHQPVASTAVSLGTIFASSAVSSGGTGTIGDPFSLRGALEAAIAGDVVFLRGGTYSLDTLGGGHYILTAIGTSSDPIIIESYPGEWAILDGQKTAWNTPSRGIQLNGHYYQLRNLEIRNMAYYYGLYVSGSNNILENVNINNCYGSGFNQQTGSLGVPTGNIYRSCRANDCSSAGIPELNDGGDTDGFSLTTGNNTVIEYCEALRCSDDGIDLWQTTNSVVRYCVSGEHGIASGNGNGYKLGSLSVSTGNYCHHSFAFGNQSNGFNQNGGDSLIVEYCTSYNNQGNGYTGEADTIVRYCISKSDTNGTDNGSVGTLTGNSWQAPHGGNPLFQSTTYPTSNFLRPTAGGGYEDIGAWV